MPQPKFNPAWNTHYNFDDPACLAEIEKVESYDIHADTAVYHAGDKINSPWGDNQVISISRDNHRDVCIKTITVRPGFMLSLQRHRARTELLEVTHGILTVIADGRRVELAAGQSITLPPGCVHCMNNFHDDPVIVRETQTGIAREADNVRLMDFNGRPVYPLTSVVEFDSATLYARMMREIRGRAGFTTAAE